MTDDKGESSIRTLAQNAVQANKDHQHALKIYTERLEAELETVDKLLDAVDTADQNEEPELDVGGFVLVPGSVKPIGLIAPADLSSQDSPFYEDAARRTRYLNFTEMHTMKYREIEALTEAVRTENYRRHALDAQSRGHRAFAAITDQPSNYLELNKAGIDWGRVAEKVSSVSSTPRSSRECEIRWLGDRHPEINHSNWDQEEVSRLKAMVSDVPEGQVDWVDIAEKLGTKRTPLDCMKHAITRKIHVWDSQSDKRLMEAMDRYGTENWHLTIVARYVSEDATPAQCTNRYYRSLDPGLKRGAWTPEEDERLRLAYAAFGASWIDVASVVPGRNNDQCRDRWMDKLNPSVSNGKWSDDEDRLLMETIDTLGIASWKEISGRMSGRTDNMCRNRYETLKKKDKNITPASSLSTSGPSREASRPRKTKSTVLPAASTVNVADQQTTEVTAPKPRPRPRPTKKHDIQFVDPIVASYPDNRSSPTKKTEVTNKDKSKDQGRGKGKGKEKATESVSGGVAGVSQSVVMSHENIPGDSAAAPPTKKRKTSRPAPRNAKGKDRENIGSSIRTSNVDIDANGDASLVDVGRAEARPPDSIGFQANIGPPSGSQLSSTNPEIVHNDKEVHLNDSLATNAPPIKPTKGGRKKPTTTVPPTRVQPQRTSRKTSTST
ncbi:hypothetical protein SERLA73DRAFT_158888 [Serpula lacrymans var. lacrymans S7.3]|uniref:Uncharacterized protein n=2 Tax=Serpula lacrymans var. lacrymans TaxID=341189 RepID=F8PR03_SERL3|nr:uncharacterized protein SERLADRAFT_413763 [Serpula lacrymans var. lacrymans S7.9]EGO01660.1 hypothetical protein SERLA73DRAFT_158888 [Serpula lacrymans var. lacrymans S7.3]EGO27306.1 hypothetical protein SERLADRAFT_413763 [Serpula lacrymans var. lacrymans S7.9]